MLAGPVQPGQETYFQTQVAPHLDGDWIRYVGEIGGTVRQDLFAGARALVMPIRWPEPFGLVMVEALVCGTPVIAFAEGAATEIVRDAVTGFLVSDERQMAAAVAKLSELNPADCRADAVARFSPTNIAASYEQVYARAIAHDRTPASVHQMRGGAAHGRWLSASEGRDAVRVGRGSSARPTRSRAGHPPVRPSRCL